MTRVVQIWDDLSLIHCATIFSTTWSTLEELCISLNCMRTSANWICVISMSVFVSFYKFFSIYLYYWAPRKTIFGVVSQCMSLQKYTGQKMRPLFVLGEVRFCQSDRVHSKSLAQFLVDTSDTVIRRAEVQSCMTDLGRKRICAAACTLHCRTR